MDATIAVTVANASALAGSVAAKGSD